MLKELLEKNATSEEINKALEDIHAHDIVLMLDTLNNDEQNQILSSLSTEKLAEVLSYLNPEDAALVFTDLTLDEQKEMVEELDPDDAADIINELDDSDKNELLLSLDKDEEVLSLINYDEYVAGSYMTNDMIKVLDSDDIKTATKKLISRASEVDSIQTIFVTDEAGKYVGQMSLRKLIRAKMPLLVSDILEVEPTINEYEEVDNLVKHMKHYGGYDLGIVNNQNILVGAITMDDILDIYQEETQEDIEKLAALPDIDPDQNVFLSAFHRLPWLIILLVLSIPIALVTSNFEEILASVVILALFQPLILDSGGDVASQTLAVTLISLTSKGGSSIKNGINEILSGIFSGLVMGLMAFIATLIFANIMQIDHGLTVALVVGLSLWFTVIFAPILGFVIPISLKILKLDPAVASGPLITTLIDVVSILVYFGIATLMLGGIYHG